MEAALNGPFGRVTLGATPLTIGRTPDNQLVLADASVSSHHAEIRTQGQDYVLIDLGSANGTFLDERRLDPYEPNLLHEADIVRIGDTRFTYDVAGLSEAEPTIYGGSHQESGPGHAPIVAGLSVPATGYGSYQSAAFQPDAPYPDEPAFDYGSGAQLATYQPPPPPPGSETAIYPPSPSSYGTPVSSPTQGPKRRGLWIILGAIGALVVIGLVLFGVIAYVNRSTPTRSLNAFCDALKSGDYQTAYNQLSSGLQSKFGSEAQFVDDFSSNAGLGKVKNCTLTKVDDAAGTGTISNTFADGSTLVVDYTLLNENGAWKINSQQPRSTPTLTMHIWCFALKSGDYPTAYNQLSSAAQSQESEAQLANLFSPGPLGHLTECRVSQVSDTAGTGTVTYTFSSGAMTTTDFTLVNESSTWKISSRQLRSSPTVTLDIYCSALKSRNYPGAYNQLSSIAQSQESEARFAANFSSGQVADCVVSNVNDAAGTGTLTYTFSSGIKLTADYTLVNEGGTWKIQREQLRSTPTLTLLIFCSALKSGNYTLAYNQLSSSQQQQQSEAQFVNMFIHNPVSTCVVSNVDDVAGTGTQMRTSADGSSNTVDFTLIDENGTWKINTRHVRP